MSKLLESLGPWGIALGAIFTILFGFFALISKSEPSRKRVIHYLEQDTVANTYRTIISGFLNKTDKLLSPQEIKLGFRKSSIVRAWSVGLLGAALIFALAYPILSVLVQWLITGEGRIGTSTIIPPESNSLVRWIAGLALVTSLSLILFAQIQLTGWPRLGLELFGLMLIFFGAFAGPGAFAIVFLVAVTLSVALTSRVAMSRVLTGSYALTTGRFGLTGPLASTFAGAGASAIIFAVAYAIGPTIAISIAGAIAAIYAFSSIFAGAATSAGIGTFTAQIYWLTGKVRYPALPLFILSLAGVAIIVAVILKTGAYPVESNGQNVAASILFYAVLPLLNGLADFFSLGMTRYYLRRGLAGNLIVNGFKDLVAGLLIFFLLGFVMIAYIHWVRPQSGDPLLELGPLFDDLRIHPGNYWWLFIMMFSTLLPTVSHVCVWLFASFTLLGRDLRVKLARGLRLGQKGDAHPDWLARAALCMIIAFAIWVPAFVLIKTFTLFPGIVQGIIGIFEAFAQTIGAAPAGNMI